MKNWGTLRLALSFLSAVSFSTITSDAKSVLDFECAKNSGRIIPSSSRSDNLREKLEEQLSAHDQAAAETWSDYFFALGLENTSPKDIDVERKSLMDKYSRHAVMGVASRRQQEHKELQQSSNAKSKLNRLLEQLAKLPCDQKQERQNIYGNFCSVISSTDSPSNEDLRCGELVIDSIFCDSSPNFRSFDTLLYSLLHTMRNKYCAKESSRRVLDLALEKGSLAAHNKDTLSLVQELTGPRYFCELWNIFPPESVLSRQKRLTDIFASTQAGAALSPTLNFRLACAYLKCNKMNEAQEILQSILSSNNPENCNIGDFWVRILLAESYLRMGRLGECKKSLDAVAKLIALEDNKYKAEHNAYLEAYKAKLCMKNKHFSEANIHLRRADDWFGSRLMVKDPVSEDEHYIGDILPTELSVLQDLVSTEGKMKRAKANITPAFSAKKALEKFRADKASNDSELATRKFLQAVTSGSIEQPAEFQHWMEQIDSAMVVPDMHSLLFSAQRLRQSGDLELADKVYSIVLDRFSKNIQKQELAHVIQNKMEISLSLGNYSDLEKSICDARSKWSDALVQSVVDGYETHLCWLMNDPKKMRSFAQSLRRPNSIAEKMAQAGTKIDLAQVLVSDGLYAEARDLLVAALQEPGGPSRRESSVRFPRWREGAALLSLCYAESGNSTRANSIFDSLRRTPPTNESLVDKSYLMFFQDRVGGVIAENERNSLRALRYYTQAMEWLDNSNFSKSPQGIRFKSDLTVRIARMQKKLAAARG